MASPEQELIRSLFAPLADGFPGAFGMRDDAAVVAPGAGEEFVITKDAVVAGVHFFADDPADLVARKALRVNISDLAAKGAVPRYYLLAASLPKELPHDWLEGLVSGLAHDQDEYGCVLIGGDTVSTPGPLTLSITAIGSLPGGEMVTRSGAREGDAIYVTGSIGDAALAFAIVDRSADAGSLGAAEREWLQQRYHLPQPRVDASAFLRRHASAAMDISDGLAGDLSLLCEASGVGASVQAAEVPLSKAAARLVAKDEALLERALTGGDDYEILFTVEASTDVAGLARSSGMDCVAARIGTVTAAGEGVRFIDADGAERNFSRASFSHL